MQFTEEMLTAYLDDELSGTEREIVEQTIDADPSCAERLQELRTIRDAVAQLPPIRPLADPVLAVRQRIQAKQLASSAASERRVQAFGRLTVLATAACLMLAIGAYLLRSEGPSTGQPNGEIIASGAATGDPQITESLELRDGVAFESQPAAADVGLQLQRDFQSTEEADAAPQISAMERTQPSPEAELAKPLAAPPATSAMQRQSAELNGSAMGMGGMRQRSRAQPYAARTAPQIQADRGAEGFGQAIQDNATAPAQAARRYFYRETDLNTGELSTTADTPRVESPMAKSTQAPLDSQASPATAPQRSIAAAADKFDAAQRPNSAAKDDTLQYSNRTGSPAKNRVADAPQLQQFQNLQIQSSPDLIAPQLIKIQQLLADQNLISQPNPSSREEEKLKGNNDPLKESAATANQAVQLIISGRPETLQQVAEQILKTVAGRERGNLKTTFQTSPSDDASPILVIDLLP
ncbi:hypothetical protein Poly24_37670 [Rosistilla carotiformis]|uniref:Zinc-finger domain-containing protein n=1 Tax=Rosistilla carotiformis TaxID=2528017 RepID=A0A518JWY6_9BACT|nr:hypothetical protein [Rosistilla carotiformis]QDV70048.1 hypothetical protein Poly24_37670 [Rosistilla carotiformis]